MIVFDLVCHDGGHQFEGWFGSSDDYEKQKAAGFIDCPTCGSSAVDKAVMAPNVGIKSNQRSDSARKGARQTALPRTTGQSASAEGGQAMTQSVPIPPEYQELVSKLAKAQAKILETSEWVGGDFPERARAIHYGEKEAAPIHGTATMDEVADLEDEGIDIMPLPLPVTPPKAQN